MLLSRANRYGYLSAAAALLVSVAVFFAAGAASAADTMALWNNGIKKGDIAVRMESGVREAALDQAVSALGLTSHSANGAFSVTLDGKKLEAWNASNVIRAAGVITSTASPVSYSDGHWWVTASSLTQALGHFYAAIKKSAAFELRPSGSASSAASVPAASAPAPQPEPVKKAETPAPAPAQTPAPARTEAKTETPKAQVQIPPQDNIQPAAQEEPAKPAARITPAFTGSKRPVVVVDAGHGGHDPGASGNGLREKDINLKAAVQLGELLRQYGVDARLSRRTDVYLKLAERTEFANKNNADVFVSLHCNAAGRGGASVSGLEYYIMASPSDKDALNLAIAENKEISTGMDTAKDAQRADKKTQLLLKILGDMQQNDKINESTTLTEGLNRNAKAAGLPVRKVKQAPFFVLRGAAMPAVLVEMGYITSPSESRRLASASYRDQLMRSIAQGVVQYIKDHPTQVK